MEYKIEEIKDEIKEGNCQLVDVREEVEWDEGHLKDATLFSLSSIQAGEDLPGSLDKSKKTYLHCRSGARVKAAEPLLIEMGFTNIIPLQEGFDELVDEDFEEA